MQEPSGEGKYWPYHKRRDIGIVFRVGPVDGTIHVAGVLSGSPACKAGISAGWRRFERAPLCGVGCCAQFGSRRRVRVDLVVDFGPRR